VPHQSKSISRTPSPAKWTFRARTSLNTDIPGTDAQRCDAGEESAVGWVDEDDARSEIKLQGGLEAEAETECCWRVSLISSPNLTGKMVSCATGW
jgi:hypothetical protein